MSEYNADSIKVLSDLSHVRTRYGMYIGEADNPKHLLTEIIDNAIDEIQNGFSKEICVSINTKLNEYKVRDYGRGIPHGKKLSENGIEKEILELIFTTTKSGGKFDNNSYLISAGTNGVGCAVVNALSKRLIVTSYRDHKSVTLLCSNGGIVNDIQYNPNCKYINGTEVSFIPDDTIFKDSIIPIDIIKLKCKVNTALGYKTRLIIDGEEFDTSGDMFSIINDPQEIKTYAQFPQFNVSNDNEEFMKVAIRYTNDTTDHYFGFANLTINSMGGTHTIELSRTIMNTWEEFLNSHKRLKSDGIELRKSDYLVGLRAVCAVFIKNTVFTSQTKEKLAVDKKYLNQLMDNFKNDFIKYLHKNIDIAAQLVKRFEEYRTSQNKLLSRKEISSIIKINNDDPNSIRRRSVVSKLRECTSKSRENTELLITEGNSAAGPVCRARNNILQAVLPLRGKILNVTNMSPKDAVRSQEVCNIVNSVGCGLASQCDSSKSRYDRVIYIGDPDADSYNITCLVLSVFINMLPDMVRAGKVYITMPYLYLWYDKSGNMHGSNDRKEIPDNVKFSRCKGLGECEDEELGYMCINPKTRNIVQVDYPSDIAEFNRIVGSGQGKRDLLTDLGIIKHI